METLLVNEFSKREAENPSSWKLLTNTRDITDIILGWDLEDNIEIGEVGYLFVKWNDNDDGIEEVWYGEGNIPWNYRKVYRLL